jgi:hypothetical protein
MSTFYCDPSKYAIFTKIEVYLKWIKLILDEVEEKTLEKEILSNYEPIL